MSQSKVETNWITDRSRLVSCGDRHKALADFYARRDAALQKDPIYQNPQ